MNVSDTWRCEKEKEKAVIMNRQIDNVDIKKLQKKYFQLKMCYNSITKEVIRMNAKETMGVVIFIAIFMAILMFGANRIEKIEKGEMVLVNQSEMK